MSELDKFKRRTIRSVARLLLKEKKPPEELWKEMKKETGTDCRTLWERMRALCVKKLNRMIAVDDRSANLPSIARLSLTDWLLVDLVLVHEEIDVIAMDKPDNKEYPALIELFSLVQRFDIEGRSGEPLAEAWAAATVFYNRQGRQCSPMLLQRRWYQLKKLTRCRFYKFWFSYKGNTRLLEEARKAMPSRLQMAIAKRYPNVITKEYPDWEELIEKRFIIMPEEFEAKMRMPNLPKPCNSNAPDLVVVEPVIETIDLRLESDPEDQNDDEMEDTSDPERSNDATDITHPATEDETPVGEEEKLVTEEEVPVNEEIPINDETSGIKVKTEPMEEDGLSNVQVISATHVPEVEIPDDSPDETPEVVSTNSDEVVVKSEVSQMETSPDDDEDDIIEIPSVTPVVELSPEKNIERETAEIPTNNVPCDVDIINDSDDAVNDIIKVKADEYCRKRDEVPFEKKNEIDDLIKDKVETYLKTPKDTISLSDKKPNGATNDLKNKANAAAIDLMADLNFVDDGIEFVDDGVEFIEEDHAQSIESTTKIPSSKPIDDNLPAVDQTEEVDAESNKFDIKLLMYPVVYTTKLDQMKTFKNKEIDSVEGVDNIEMAVIESKPVSNKSLDIKIKEESVITTAGDTADSDDLFTNREITDDEDSEEDIIVPKNSYMLKKPRTRTYDPIKLCKNPDFNTKLKRLTIGFLSSTRNRQLLNACIPMTIDLSKAFESKLVNGTLYLKPSDTAPIVEKQEVLEKQASSIVPTAMSVQSLIDNSKVDIQNLIPHQSPIVSERTKVINLPDIDKVRRINQQLLTAQVLPLRVTAGNSRTTNPQEVTPTVSTVPSIEPVQPVTDSTSIPNTVPKIKIEGEKSENDSLPTESTETLPPAKEKLLKMINQAKILTKEALDKIDDVTKPKDFPMPIVVQEVKNNIPQEVPTRKHHYQPRVPLPWAPKLTVPTKNNFDDFGLLTSDTLNKMLHLLTSGKEVDGCKCCNIPKKKKKKVKRKKSDDQQKDSDNSDSVQEVDKEDESKKSEVAVAKQAPKQTTKVVPLSKVVKTKFCCWANQKLNNRRRNSKHLCPPNPCQCCCADKLVKKIQADEEARRSKMMAKTVVELSDDEEDSLRKACESIETVVQQSALLTDQANDFGQVKTSVVPAVSVVDRIPVPIVKVAQRSPDVSTVTVVDSAPDVPNVTVVSPAKPSIPSINVEVVAPSISKVTIDLGVNADEIKETPTTPTKPYMKIRAAPISSLMPVDRPSIRPILNRPTVPQINPVTVNSGHLPNVQIHSQRTPSQWASCSCQRPALSQDTRRNIVIDASKHCVMHPTPIAPKQIVSPQKIDTSLQIPQTPKEKILYLHSKSLAKSPPESPIFLGKNKILLTTVKFPRKNNDVAPTTEVFQSPKVIPTLPLPAGVQLVLMPSGNVTYTVDPGVELDETQLAALPTILAAVQEQLNASCVTSSPAVPEPQVSAAGDVEPVTAVTQPETSGSENTNLPQSDETAETPRAENNINELIDPPESLETNEVFQDTELPPKNTNNEDMEVDTRSTKADGPTEQNTSTTTSTSDTEKESAPMTDDTVSGATIDPEAPKSITEPLASAQTAPAVEESQSEKQTLETQSVSENKEAPEGTQEIQSVAEGKEDGISNRKSLLSDLMEMSGISAEDTTVPDPPAPEPLVIDQVQDAAIENDESRNLPELSPVTSFAELKYACEQNGKFFKLDFDTGVIVPINVCIKKNPKTKTTPKTKEFIDLTDDVETVESMTLENAEPGDILNKSNDDRPASSSLLKEPVEYLYNGKTVNVSSSIVKPVKLFKAFRPTPKVPRVLKAGPRTVPSYNSPSLLKRTHIEKRKQKLTIVRAKVEAKIDLVDSDEPMEEEYLLDSSDDDTEAEPILVEALNTSLLDDSSDDEPLAKKSKRLKEADAKEVRETNIFDEIPDVPSPDELTNDVNNLVMDIETAAVTGGTGQVQQLSVKKGVVPKSSKKNATSCSKIDEPRAKVRKILEPNVVVRSEGPIIEIQAHNPVDNQSDDEELDKAPPELRFLSDHSEDGDGDEDCILGF
ncbi:uncharacterized protein LOC133530303 [Cydia pomonella]|uniref:uncharacterized protein LOC133530303 n=1 Tax=Cydia pomonella TaxID=82600 RepID=UPI002ADDB709|nr:uncharacterized protein LOC133530303 [Cydia pomonella]